MAIEPTPDQIEALAAAAQSNGEPVVMINLLRFKAQADGIDAADAITGAEAYGRYAAHAQEYLQRAGGEVLLALAATDAVIGPPGEWDMVLAVRYPSRRAFLDMIGDPGYLAIHGHRAAALADSRLIGCTPVAA